MKTSTILLAFIFTCLSAWAQWEPQNSGTTHQLNSVYFIDTLNGWVSGGWSDSLAHGLILHTEDGGETWEEQYSGIGSGLLSCINFTNSSLGWAGTKYSGNLYRTVDGGITWEKSELFEGLSYKICFSDSLNGWAIGSPNWYGNFYGGEISHSNDGGITWETQLLLDPQNGGLYSVFFIDSLNGWVSGGDVNGSTGFWDAFILHTCDGGNSWTYQFEYNSRYGYILRDIWFTDTLHGWSVGGNGPYQRGVILKTIDGGNNWDTSYYDTLSGTFGFKAVAFADSFNGWAVAENGRILSTSDGGNTWITNQSATEQDLNCVYFTKNGHGWAVGDSGTILHADYSQIVGQEEFRCSGLKFDVRVYPNPFATSTTLSYILDKPENVQFTVYNVQSQIVYIVHEWQDKGERQVQWNAKGLPAGMYYFRIQAGDKVGSGKMVKMN